MCAEPSLEHTSGALKAWLCCLQGLLDAAPVFCSTLHLCNVCEKMGRALQQGVQNLVGLYACMGSQQMHLSMLWLDQTDKVRTSLSEFKKQFNCALSHGV